MIPVWMSTFLFVVGIGSWFVFWFYWYRTESEREENAKKLKEEKREYYWFLYLNKLRKHNALFDQLICDYMFVMIDQGASEEKIKTFLDQQISARGGKSE